VLADMPAGFDNYDRVLEDSESDQTISLDNGASRNGKNQARRTPASFSDDLDLV